MIDILGKEKDHGRGGARVIYFRTRSQEDGGQEREEGRGVVGKEEGGLGEPQLESSYLCVGSQQAVYWEVEVMFRVRPWDAIVSPF